jgi:RNA polymerase sigma-70 factor (ECF subfamily)
LRSRIHLDDRLVGAFEGRLGRMMTGRPPPDSFAEVHERYREKVLAYLCRLTRQPALAEDLAQETFFRASRALESFRGEAKLSTWLYRIATNLYFDHRRRESSRPAEVRDVVRQAGETAGSAEVSVSGPRLPDRLFEDSEMGRCVREFVDQLPPDHKAVIILHDLEGFKNREIAAVLDCSLDAVKIRIHRARRSLRTLLAEDCEFYYDERDVLRCDRKQSGGRCSS